MLLHQGIGIDTKIVAFYAFSQKAEKLFSVGFLMKEALSVQ
jgi:hypothetical protein